MQDDISALVAAITANLPGRFPVDIALWEMLLNDVTRSVFSAGFDCGWEASLKQDAFHKLGARLSELLDEDQWAECEALLLSAGVTPNAALTGSPEAQP